MVYLDKSEIRVRYSGFIIFASQIISIVTGLIFTLLLTRNMPTGKFGIWSAIFYFTSLFILFSNLFPFWATRFVARGKEGATKTAFSANIVLAAISMVIYLIILAPLLSAFNISSTYLPIYAIASLYILDMFLITALEGCLQSIKPQAKGYGLLIEEIVKVILAFVFIVGLKQLFLGAILSIIGGASVQVTFYTWLLKDEFKQPIRWNYLREWLKGSTALFYNIFGAQLSNLVFYVLLYYSGQSALGGYQAAVTFSVVIGYASSLAFALYPKMLAKECPEDVSNSLKTVLMLALPMVAVALAMSRSLLVILNVSYGVAAPILILLTINALVNLISGFYTQCLMGVEAFDIEGKIPIRQLVKSKIFKVFSMNYIEVAIILPLLFLVLPRVGSGDPVLATMYMVVVIIAANVISPVGLYAFMRGCVKIKVAWKSIGKYVLGSLVEAAILLILPQTTTLAATFGKILAGVAVYMAFIYTIDFDVRKLAIQVWEEIKGTVK